MRGIKGYPLPLGISERNGIVNFSVEVENGRKCNLCIYKKGEQLPEMVIELRQEEAVGAVRFTALPLSKVKGREYNYEIDGIKQLDAYVKAYFANNYTGELRGKVLMDSYDWQGDIPLHIPNHEVIAYSLHVRGFTKHRSSGVKNKGTFCGLVEKIPYLKELGVNQVQCMPIYDFDEATPYINYWGYGDAKCFAIKKKYASTKHPEKELKDMVKACHKEGIEVVLNLPFTAETPKHIVVECLRYYVMEFHIDGFVLNPYNAPMSSILSDPILKKTKILEYKDDFQNNMRSFLIGNEGTVQVVMWWVKQITKDIGCCNYIANHTGFTPGYFIKNPVRFFEIILNTIWIKSDVYFSQMFGCLLGWLDINIPFVFTLGFVLILVYVAMRKENEEQLIKNGERIWMIIVFIGIICTAVAGMLFNWTPNNADCIEGVQGRYFLPALVLGLIALRTKKTGISVNSDRYGMMWTVFLHVIVVTTVFRNIP